MNENLFQNLIFLGIMSATLKDRGSIVRMKMTPFTNPFGSVEKVSIKLYTNEKDKEELEFSYMELSRFSWKDLKKYLLPIVSLMELSA